ncbi:CRISPR-associated endonuclease Cas3'' [Bifidobacterium pullorum]|uniref:CRISPR-associated endonuclease Cas3'' n=1 Tax=Bifidobacterium pullorum TaxID=78448 RepID=UPI0009DD5989|nr:CRISPR-associated endonuclease Cas3'' [Bifidobacterium pullorum]
MASTAQLNTHGSDTPDFGIGIPHGLSEQTLSVWAKTNLADPSDPSYLQLWQHLEDTAATASHVWDDFLPNHVKELLATDLGGMNEARATLLFLCGVHDAGKASPAFEMMNQRCATRTQHTGLTIEYDFFGVENRSRIRHELVGYRDLCDWLTVRATARPGTSDQGNEHSPTNTSRQAQPTLPALGLANVVGGHHGTSINDDQRRLLRGNAGARRLAGLPRDSAPSNWQRCRFELFDWMAAANGLDAISPIWPQRPVPKRSQTLLTAAVIICDWIASNTRYFPLNASEQDEAVFNAAGRAARAWKELGIPTPWRAPHSTKSAPDTTSPDGVRTAYDRLFAERFRIPDATLRPAQRAAVEAADTMAEPGLMILEANMGEGKTEAALLAAERLADRFHLGGVYYALPTQATVNAMFTRFTNWIEQLPAGNRPAFASIFLAHGKRDLNDEFAALRTRRHGDGTSAETAFNEFNDDYELRWSMDHANSDGHSNGRSDSRQHALSAVVNPWLSGRKRGNLSDFVVGTIDQVLMAALRSKHVVLRHLALAGKVVVLDEVHANTAYMNMFMERVLSWLAYYETPVIMLSATLPQQRRLAYLQAYEAGRRALRSERRYALDYTCGHDHSESADNVATSSDAERQHGSRARWRQRREHDATNAAQTPATTPPPSPDVQSTYDLRYPLISLSGDDAPRYIAPESSGRSSRVTVRYCDDSDESLTSLLRTQLTDGGCAIVIRDTVARAQHAYQLIRRELAEDLGADVTLAHSRFLAFDRARIDRDLVHRFGPDGADRPHCAIVVATQVAEQSLDVDFDLMVTDVAPVDLILQRAGRLHRHRRGADERPERLRAPQLFVTGIAKWKDDAAPEFSASVATVYHRHLLLRSLAALGISPDANRVVDIPTAIPELVQRTYGSDPIGPESWRDAMNAAAEAWVNQQDRKQADAMSFRILDPGSSPCDLDNWLDRDPLDDPDGRSDKARQARAAVRDSDENVEVIVLQQTSDGLQLPAWGDFHSDDPLPNGMGMPSGDQIRDILSCTISLSRYSAGCSLDAFIRGAELRCTGPDAVSRLWMDWQRVPELAGQLLLLLDADGCVSVNIEEYPNDDAATSTRRKPIRRTIAYRYTPEVGWQAIRDE